MIRRRFELCAKHWKKSPLQYVRAVHWTKQLYAWYQFPCLTAWRISGYGEALNQSPSTVFCLLYAVAQACRAKIQIINWIAGLCIERVYNRAGTRSKCVGDASTRCILSEDRSNVRLWRTPSVFRFKTFSELIGQWIISFAYTRSLRTHSGLQVSPDPSLWSRSQPRAPATRVLHVLVRSFQRRTARVVQLGKRSLRCHGTDIFEGYTVHNNFFFIFDTASVFTHLSDFAIREVQRRAVCLLFLNDICFHMSGEYKI